MRSIKAKFISSLFEFAVAISDFLFVTRLKFNLSHLKGVTYMIQYKPVSVNINYKCILTRKLNYARINLI